jgi:hypothetical protein
VDAQTALNELVYASGDYTLIGEGKRVTGTGESDDLEPTKHYATRYKRCLLVHTPNGRLTSEGENEGRIICREHDGQPFAFWNETLKGYVVRPTEENVKEVCEWLEELNA